MSNKRAAEASIATATGAFTVNELATFLRVSRATVWRLLKSGQIPRARIGGRTVIRRVDADALLARCIQEAG